MNSISNWHADAGATKAVKPMDFIIGSLESSFGGAVGDDDEASDAGLISDVFGFVLANAADGNVMASEDMSDVREDSGTIGNGESEVVSAREFFSGLQWERRTFAHAKHGLEIECSSAGGTIDEVGNDC